MDNYEVAIITLGCAKNEVDSEHLGALLENGAFSLVEDPQRAEVLVVNTCGFINSAKEESIQAILSAVQLKNKGRCRKLVVAGCLAERYSKELWEEIPEIDCIIGPGRLGEVVEAVHQTLAGEKPMYTGNSVTAVNFPRKPSGKATAYLKIAEGCDNHCAYCAIPSIKGSYRSKPVENILTEASHLVSAGVSELVLVAQDTTRYGQDLPGSPCLVDLLRELDRMPGLHWIRILYAYPDLVSPALIDVMADSRRICHYLDIPLQHASDQILSRMNRRTSQHGLRSLIHTLRQHMPDIALRSTFIVGFPGETEGDFAELREFIMEMKFDWVGFFQYSPEEGTPAAVMPNQVDPQTARARWQQLTDIQQRISATVNQGFVGKKMRVLVEEPSLLFSGMWCGRTYRQAPDVDGQVHFPAHELKPGDWVDVRITGVSDIDLVGELLTDGNS